MIEFIWDPIFKRRYKKKIVVNPNLKIKFKEAIELFASEPFHPSLRTHKLSGPLKDCWSFSLDNNYRVIFQFKNNDKVLLVDIGSHDEVY